MSQRDTGTLRWSFLAKFLASLFLISSFTGLQAQDALTGSQSAQTSRSMLADYDGDGVDDSTDIDDDNDGVLDADEQDCTSLFPLNSFTYNGVVVSSASAEEIVTATQAGWRTSYSQEPLSPPLHFEYQYNIGGNGMVGLIANGATQNTNTWNDGAFKYYMVNNSLYGRVEGAWNPYNIPLADGDILSWTINAAGFVTGRQNGNVIVTFQSTATTYFLAFTSLNSQTYTDMSLEVTDPNGCLDKDTDGDNIPDRLDLDSDGDGCTDALEAGATTTTSSNYQFTSSAGSTTDANSDGLADIVDSDQNGSPDYSSTYLTNALDPSVGSCLDFDNDGVEDAKDLDDDNDGIYDTDEMNCPVAPSISDFTFNGAAVQSTAGSTLVTSAQSTWNSSYSAESLSLPAYLQYTYSAASSTSMFGIIAEGATQDVNTWNDGGYKFYHVNGTLYGRANGSWNPYGIAIAAGDVMSWEVSESGYVIARQNGDIILQFQGVVADYKIVVSSRGSQTYTNVTVDGPDSFVCTDIDSDSDGIPDRLDADSDNDGCLDVAEAGFTDSNEDGELDGTGYSAQGLVTGNSDGYTGTNQDVTLGSSSSCVLDLTDFNVNIDSDLNDVNIGDGVCADANGDCSLRAAIQEANASTGLDRILFDISGEIVVGSALPVAYGQIIFDGTSAPGYQQGAPTVSIRGNGFNLIQLSEASESVVRGLDLSGSSSTGHDSFGIVLALCNDVTIADNIIRNRVRAIHSNGSCDVKVLNNDLRDSGLGTSHAAVYMINVCPSSTDDAEMAIKGNQFGALNAVSTTAIQIASAYGVYCSDDASSESQIVLTTPLDMEFPMRYINVQNGGVKDVDLSGSTAEGIGLRLLNCEAISVENVGLRDRFVGIEVLNGVGHSIVDCDFTGSGTSEYSPAIRLSGITTSSQADLFVSGNTLSSSSEAILQLNTCNGITIAAQAGSAPNILFDQQFNSHTAIRLEDSDNIHISGQSFQRDDRLIGTEGIMIDDYSNGVTIEDCYFEGFASGVNLARADAANLYCNTFVQNANAIWVYYDSNINDMDQNAFMSNGIGIYNHTSIQVVSDNDYWGHPSGSSSFAGLGDYFVGDVDASVWSFTPPVCIATVPAALCQMEICDNGIDDDGDGVVDCDDGSCLNSTACGSEFEQSDLSKSLDTSELAMSAYPNPTSGVLNLVIESDCLRLIVMDMNGRVVREYSNIMSGELTIDLSDFDQGVYVIHAQKQDGNEMIKVIKD